MDHKPIKFMFAVILAASALVALVGVLASGRLGAARAESAAPLTLPTPYLNHRDVADAPYSLLNIWPLPATDGVIAPGEYAHAGRVAFPGYGGYYREVEVFFYQDGAVLHVAFEMPDKTNANPYASLFLDTLNDDNTQPQSDDFQFNVMRSGIAQEYQGDGTTWVQNTGPLGWAYGLTETMTGWSVEFAIPFTQLGIISGTFQELGLTLGNWAAGPSHFWPAGAISNDPSTWGSLVSSSDWGTFYWKPGPWEDYAPSGMPDFDQHQDAWSIPSPGPGGLIWTHCGPVAMANSLWWFDSKFETATGTMPFTVSDSYRLVRSYNPQVWDDHDPGNVIPFVDDLANNYFGTNQGVMGTNVISMFHGTQRYLRDHGLWDDYLVTLVHQPSFEWIADEVMRSEDVVLLLGFWEEDSPGSGTWHRIGGHFVTVAGVDAGQRLLAFSDPAQDAAEMPGPGRVLSSTLITHSPIPGHAPMVHNDAGNVSHDVYLAQSSSPSPGGKWWLPDYEPPLLLLETPGLNPNPRWEEPPGPWLGSYIHTEIEFALAVSPHTWKASGEWEPADDPVFGAWQPWADYAPNGVPDFDQQQDNWMNPNSGMWSYCGPVAAANSLWWFDAKFEPAPLGPTQPVTLPMPAPGYSPPVNDHYPMVWSYWAPGQAVDDHDPNNVESGAPSPIPALPVPWPPPPSAPPSEFVDELAAYFDTDDQTPPFTGLRSGTMVNDLYNGIDQYLWNRIDPSIPSPPLRQGYVITIAHKPEFWWVAEEVEHSEDVILLLGFWEWQSDPTGLDHWVRLGGHYVTVPGVDKKGGLIAFSDPWFDRIEQTWPFAGIGSVGGWPSYLGRVADGWIVAHPPYQPPHAPVVHNDAGNVSHDVYRVVGTNSPGGTWGPEDYVDSWGSIENFWGQNGQEDTPSYGGGPIQAEVEWAVAVSPVADVWVGKRFTPDPVTPGATVTITIPFGNEGSLVAHNVVISDALPAALINPAWSYWTSNGGTVTLRTGTTFTWDAPDLAWMEHGVITLTAQVDPALDWPATQTLTNVVHIHTSSLEQYQITPLLNVATATLTVNRPDVGIVKTVTPTGALENGDWLTFTLVYSNAGPGTATSVMITDVVPLSLTHVSYSAAGASIIPTGTISYTWQVVGTLPSGAGGVITITAQVTRTWPFTSVLYNEAVIGTPDDHDATNDHSALTVPVTGPRLYLPLVLRNN